MSKYKYAELGSLIQQAKTVRCGSSEYPVLSMTMHNGLVFQDEKFKKVIASKDRSDYKVVYRNQLVVGFPIDEGVLASQRIVDAGIVSPAYGIWDIDQAQILSEFLEYALRCDRAIQYYKAKLRGSTARRRSLPTPTLLAFTIPVPDIDEQKTILDKIHKVKAVLANREEQLEQLDSLIKARFVEMFGDPVTNPNGYLVQTLQQLIDSGFITYHLDGNHGGDYPRSEEFVDSGVPYVGANSISDGNIDFSMAKYLTEERAGKLRKGIARNEDVLFAHNATVGPTVVLRTDFPKVILSTSLTAYRCNQEKIKPNYLKAYMQSDGFVRQYSGEMKQTTRNQVPITAQKKYLFLVPPLDEQDQFAAFVAQVDKSKDAIKKSLAETQTLFDSLMLQYFG